jgi:hypothetical protein
MTAGRASSASTYSPRRLPNTVRLERECTRLFRAAGSSALRPGARETSSDSTGAVTPNPEERHEENLECEKAVHRFNVSSRGCGDSRVSRANAGLSACLRIGRRLVVVRPYYIPNLPATGIRTIQWRCSAPHAPNAVAFFVFNRSDTTGAVFDAIAESTCDEPRR